MADYIDIDKFLEYQDAGIPVVDVRSPAEYEHSHIPGAVSIPLFDNEQRAIIGTLYKQQGKIQAVQKGLDFVGPNLRGFTKQVLRLNAPEIVVHCWRGGMRSSSMAMLFETLGLKCHLITGGYKSYRNYVLDYFTKEYKLIVLGGYTGSGKTDILNALEACGEQVLDLEGLANHRGSAFGAIGQHDQPSSEFFEHLVFEKLRKMDINRPIWLEDESANIGKVFVPRAIWENMLGSRFIFVNTSFDVRLDRILRDYASLDMEGLANSIKRIEKRLGFDKCKAAYEACIAGDFKTAATICLAYYDKLYAKGIEMKKERRGDYPQIDVDSLDVSSAINELIKLK